MAAALAVERGGFLMGDPMSPEKVQIQILICTSHANEETFRRHQASGLVLDGLRARGVGFHIYRPWWRTRNPQDYDGVLGWPLHPSYGDFLKHAIRLEEQCLEEGVPFVNSMRTGGHSYHNDDLARWAASGIPCARSQMIDGIELRYPVILRRNGVHRGRGVALARTPDEARGLIAGRLERWQQSGDENDSPYDMAVEYIDTRSTDGYFRKYRSYVVGERVIACHLMHGRDWMVNFDTLESTEATRAEHKRFVIDGEPRADLMRAAATALGAEIVGLDYSIMPDGRYIFWEANRLVNMAGDQTGYEHLKVRRCDREYGLAVADLVLARVQAGRMVASS